MASNDDEPKPPPLPDTGPIAYLTRIVHESARNDQTPVRVGLLLILAVTLASTPLPWSALGFASLILLALSLGHVSPTK